jgi:hypothetical protein
VALQRIAIPIIPGKFEIGMRSRSDPQNNVIFRIAPIPDPIRQKPAFGWGRSTRRRRGIFVAPRPDATVASDNIRINNRIDLFVFTLENKSKLFPLTRALKKL